MAPRSPFGVDHLQRDLKGRSVRGGLLMIGSQGARFALRLGSTAVLARLLAPEDFGLVAMLTVVTGFLGIFVGMGLATATLQRDELDQAQATLIFWLATAVGVGLALGFVAIAPAIAWFYGEPRLVGPAALLSLTFVTSGVGLQHRALLRRQMRFRALAAVEIASLVSGIAVAIALALRGAGFWSLAAMLATTSAVEALLLFAASGWRPNLRVDTAAGRGALGTGGRVSLFDALNYAGSNLDRLLLGWMWGADALGLYSRAHGLMTLPIHQLNAPLSGVFVAGLSRLRGDPARYRSTYLGVLEKLCLVTTPLIALGIGAADWIVALVLGPQWTDAAVLFAALGVAALTRPAANTAGWLFISQGRSQHLLRWGGAAAALHAVAVVAGLPWGALGVAAALALRSLVAFPLLVWLVGSEGPVSRRDIAAALALPTLLLGSCAVPLAALRLGWPALGGGAGLVLAAIGVALATGLTLGVAPAGRRALRELHAAAVGAFGRRPEIREPV